MAAKAGRHVFSLMQLGRHETRANFIFDMIHDNDAGLIRGTSIHNYNTRMKDYIRKNKVNTNCELMGVHLIEH